MTNPVPGRTITTPYGVPGGWSGGRHGGADWAAPAGALVVAPWSGTVTDANWGSAYGLQAVIDFDRLPDGSPGLWGVLAHLSSLAVSPGQRVAPGRRIGYVGSTGNATGPHLHFEVQRGPRWQSGNHVDPQPWIAAGWLFPPGSRVYRSKLGFDAHETNTDRVSDSIRMLQEMLNAHPMPGGARLPVTGRYWTGTDAEVRRCQRLHIPPEDPERGSFVGERQFAHLKAATAAPYIWYDNGPPVIG